MALLSLFMGCSQPVLAASMATDYNLYRYANNNPVMFIDPIGLSPVNRAFDWSAKLLGCAINAQNEAVDWADARRLPKEPGKLSSRFLLARFGQNWDRVQHCLASCLHAKCVGTLNTPMTLLGGVVWEHMYGIYSVGDMVADAHGIDLANKGVANCEAACEDTFDEYGHCKE